MRRYAAIPPPVFDNRIPVAPPQVRQCRLCRLRHCEFLRALPTLPTLPQRFFLRGRPGQISPAIGELALAYIRFGIRPAR
jgi:hypothetical protein